MSEYSKNLHIRKDGKIDDITLYTSKADIPGEALTLRDGNTIVYACLGNVSDSSASRLNVRKGNSIYRVLKVGIPSGHQYFSGNGSFSVPQGITKIKISYTDIRGRQMEPIYSVSPGLYNVKVYSIGGPAREHIFQIINNSTGKDVWTSVVSEYDLEIGVWWSADINNG